MSRNILKEGWTDAKAVLTEGISGNKKKVLETVLENQRKALLENAPAGATSAANIATLNKVILPIIRRVLPNVIANELVGVVPMAGPVAQINTLRFRYAESFGAPNGVTAGTEALSPYDIARFYSGNGNSDTPAGSATSALEGVRGRQLSSQIVKQLVEAKTRKLSASWTFEAAQDAQSQYGIDLEAENLAAVAAHITNEIDQEILLSLRRLSAPTLTYDQANVSGVATFVGDEHAALAILIGRAANLISQRTRQGAANRVTVSPAALTVLQSARTSAFARTTEGTFDSPSNTQFVGTLNNTQKVFVDNWASDSEVVMVSAKYSENSAPAYYCPYIPLMSTGVFLDPTNGFIATTQFMSRYGYTELADSSSSLGNAADYVENIAVQNLRFI